MKSRTEIVREGELLGPVDWSYDFRQYCASDEQCEQRKATLRLVEELLGTGKKCCVTTSYQFSHEALAVGMYDGWPFWKPTPYVLVSGPMGPDWQPYYNVTDAGPAVGKESAK